MAIVTLKEALKKAEEGGYGVGMFNVLNLEMIQSVILAAEENSSPVIMSLPEVDWWYVDTELVIKAMVEKARSSSIPVVLHYDHGHNIKFMRKLLDCGWTSLMIDESRRPLEENIEITARVVEMAREYGASVEGELGHVPGLEGQVDSPEALSQDMYTRVDEAVYFAEKTGVDALAVAIGTVHGEYKFKPALNFKRLKELQSQLKIPLVLHGGSGLSASDFKKCIELGVRKINVFTEIILEPGKVIKQRLSKQPLWKMEYTELMALSINSMKEAIKAHMDIFGSTNKA